MSARKARAAEEPGLYQDPEIYDILHAPGTAPEVGTFVRVWKRLGAGSPMVALEPACGTGRALGVLERAGWKVMGFDANEGMVRYARRATGVRGGIFVGRFDDFEQNVKAGSVGLALCPINSVRHVASDLEMVRHLRGVGKSLHRCGIYGVGISLSAYGLEGPTEDVWIGARKPVRVKQVVSFTPAMGSGSAKQRAERVDSVLEIKVGRKVEVRASSYSLLSYSREQWESVIRRAGLRVLGVVNEQSRNFDPGAIGYAIWILARADHPLAR